MFKKLIAAPFKGIKFHLDYNSNKASYPTFLLLQITEHCNSRCRMCRIWETPPKDELKLKNFERLFRKAKKRL